MKTVAFYTLGCKVNQYETEAMAELFQKKGYTIIGSEEKADVYVINTCTITSLSDRKSRQFIRRSKKRNKDAIIAAVGCYAQISPNEVLEIDEVDLVIGTANKVKIVDLCEEAMDNKKKINAVEGIMEIKEFEEIPIEEVKGKTRAFIKIQEGCNQFCSYCIIPYARGPIRSRKPENIINEVKKLSQNGFKEIVLTGIHVASYGKDLGDISLIDIIKMCNMVEGIERIRLSSIEPTIVTKPFLEELIKLEKVCDHFHLSLQSGSDTVLKRMNRKYTTDQYKEIVKLIRNYMPNAGITTDIIVGFPGESNDEFNETLYFVNKIRFSKIHVFKYSKRSGTPAAKFKGQVQEDIKHERSKTLIQLGDRIAEKFHEKMIGTTQDILFEDISDKEGYIEGYTTNYIRVMAKGSSDLEGKILSVNIIGNEKEKLIGEII